MPARSPRGRALSAARRARLGLATAARLRPRQIAARLARRARFRFLYPWLADRLYPTPAPLPDREPPVELPLSEEAAISGAPAELAARADDLAARRFAFLNLPPAELGSPVDWTFSPDGNRLWAYHLHYGEWALTLAGAARSSGEDRYLETLIELVGDWIERNPIGRAPAWDPYPTSRRLVAWSRLGAALGATAAGRGFSRRTLEPSLRRQARFLAANLEHDVPNNHLLANYRALAWVGLAFDRWPESRRWRHLGLAGLWREMERQVLPDGVHFERSITYHAAVLCDLLETWRLARRRGETVPAATAPILRRMLGFLAAARTPDGAWPMVNDSVPGDPIDPGVLLAAALELGLGEVAAPRPAVFPDAGYAVLRDSGGGYVFFDAGEMGTPEVPGHGHADALSIVLHAGRSHGGRPLVVDPGVETYEAGTSRDHCRRMAAHNTVEIDGRDPCDFWGPFRVAHPIPARLLEGSEEHLVGEHRGYLRLADGVVHRRRIERGREPGVWRIGDRFTGRGRHRFALAFQLAPGAEAEAAETVGEARWPEGTRLSIRPLAAPAGAAAIEPGWVADGWNRRRPAPRYVLRWNAEVPCEAEIELRVEGP